MNDKLIYFHINKTTKEIFYVGIGNEKRPHRIHGRSEWWNRIVNKYGYEIQIVKDNLTWEQAQVLEIFWIKTIGRKDLNEGSLVNMTNGGDGACSNLPKIPWNKGKTLSKEHKEKLSNATSNLSDETRAKLSKAQKGRKYSDEAKIKMSKSKKEYYKNKKSNNNDTSTT